MQTVLILLQEMSIRYWRIATKSAYKKYNNIT